MKVIRGVCLLCGTSLEQIPGRSLQRHPASSACDVSLTDLYGVSLSDDEIKIVEALDEPEPEIPMGWFDLHPPMEVVLGHLFDSLGMARLGGVSTGKGWSSFATAQRCLYLWRKRYVDKVRPPLVAETIYIAVGTLVHALLAIFYANMLGERRITPQGCYDYLMSHANPEFVREGWRIFSAYRLYYAHDALQPLAVEHDLKDPRTGESCRYDLIGYYSKPAPSRPAGTYAIEHKTSGRFDWDTLEGWANDGEVIGEASLWRRLGLDKRFGPLRGVIVNIIGKQQEPKFHRTVIAPTETLARAHLDDLKRWDGLLALCRSTNSFPRSRANCINRFGRCDWWEHCVTGEP